MPLADLPYHIDKLAKEGQYAYLARSTVKVKASSDTSLPIRLRVLRRVNLCDGPSLWDSIRAKRLAKSHEESDSEPYSFYVSLRLFATRSLVADYLASPELASYSQLTGIPIPNLKDSDPIVSEDNYLDTPSVEVTRSEYARMLQSRDHHVSLESLEDVLGQIQGIDSLELLTGPKRGRRRKSQTSIAIPSPQVTLPAEHSLSTGNLEVKVPSGESISEQEEDAAAESMGASPPVAEGKTTVAPKKRKSRTNLRDQFSLVQNTPSRVIDVSNFGDTMQHQHGRILDRVKHSDRIAQCTVLSNMFPVISDNLPTFERAMITLGTRYTQKITEFKLLHALRQKS